METDKKTKVYLTVSAIWVLLEVQFGCF